MSLPLANHSVLQSSLAYISTSSNSWNSLMSSEISAQPKDPAGASSDTNFIVLSPIEASSDILNTAVLAISQIPSDS